jgi:hypothetical protein
MCDSTIKNLVSRVWKNEDLDLDAGQHSFDETVLLHVSGTVTKHADQMAAPTVSIPLILTLALFWEKAGICRDHALRMLREAISEALENGKCKDEQIEARMKDIEKAVEAVKRDLIAQLPKQKRAGRVVTKDLEITVLPVADEAFATAVA